MCNTRIVVMICHGRGLLLVLVLVVVVNIFVCRCMVAKLCGAHAEHQHCDELRRWNEGMGYVRVGREHISPSSLSPLVAEVSTFVSSSSH